MIHKNVFNSGFFNYNGFMTKNLTGKNLSVLFLIFLFVFQAGALFAETKWYPIDEFKLNTSDKVTVKVSLKIAYDSANEKQFKNYGGAIPLRLKLVVLKNHSYSQMLNSEKIMAEIKNYLETEIFDYPVISAMEYVCRDKSSAIVARQSVSYTTAVVKAEEERHSVVIERPSTSVFSSSRTASKPDVQSARKETQPQTAAQTPQPAQQSIGSSDSERTVTVTIPAGTSSDDIDWNMVFASIFAPQGPAVEINPAGMTVETRIAVPEGYERVPVAAGSYEEFYRKLPLKPDGTSVYYYDGQKKTNSYHAAVYDFPNLSEDLLQCADACMKMRAEYYYAHGEYDKIGFNAESGTYLPFKKFMDGYRLTGSGWKSGYAKGSSRKIFDEYLRIVYSYASTRSMAKEVLPVAIKDLRIGDVFVQSGNPGHAVFVADMAVDKKTGKKIMLLGQGYMPAQDLHIVESFESISPWFYVEDAPFGYAGYSFPKGCQGRWPER